MDTPSPPVRTDTAASQAMAGEMRPPAYQVESCTPLTLGHQVCTPCGTGMQWELRRNCSMTPRGTISFFLLLCAVDASVAASFWLLGFPLIALFSALELSAFALALLHYGRHACDHEIVTLFDESLSIEVHCGAQVQRAVLQAAWVRVAPAASANALVGLSERGVELRIGRYVRPELRTLVARELQQSLATYRLGHLLPVEAAGPGAASSGVRSAF